ncbi:hypothetical protein L7F22_013883 [Adiantum nelumboides]|nr:hypothetical protein [Adiantum nelumboides]
MAASIKFPKRRISFKFRKKDMYINAQESGSTIPLANDQAFDKLIKSSISAYMTFVKDSLNGVNEPQVNESGIQEDLELSNFLNQFQDVFIDDILGELPPKQGDDDHMTELIPGSSSPNKPPYRVSQAQQEEIMRQVNKLVEKGMRRERCVAQALVWLQCLSPPSPRLRWKFVAKGSQRVVMQDDHEIHQGVSLPGSELNIFVKEGLDGGGMLDETCDSYFSKVRAAFVSASHGVCGAFSKRQFIKALTEMAMKDEFDESLNPDSALLLVQLINFEDPAMQMLGCLLLAKLARFIPEDSLKDAVPTLIKFLNVESSSHGLSLKEVSLLAVKRIAKKGASARLMLGNAGAIRSLLSLISEYDEKLQILALQALKGLILSENCNQERFTQAGGVQAVLNFVNSSCTKIRYLSAELVGIVARLSDVRREIANRSAVLSLIDAMKAGSMASRARAAHALGLLAFVKRVRRLIVEMGGIPVLVDLLRDGDETARLVAGNSLGIVAACVDHLWQVAQAGAISLYIDLLEGGNPHGKDIAEDAFCILAVSEENALSIIEHLVRILCHGTVESKAAAADIIWDLSSYRHSTSFVVAAGAIPVLVELLKAENEELRENVSGAIAQLTYNDDDKQALAEAGVIPILVELLQDSCMEVKGNAAEALHNFAEDPSYRSELVNASVAPSLVIIQRFAGDDVEESDHF